MILAVIVSQAVEKSRGVRVGFYCLFSSTSNSLILTTLHHNLLYGRRSVKVKASRVLDYAQIGWISYVAYKINFKHQPLMHEWVWLFIGKIRVIFGQFYHQTIRVCFPLTGTDQDHPRLIFRPMAR